MLEKYHRILFLPLLIMAGCGSKGDAKKQAKIQDTTYQVKYKLFKEYALCSCMKYAFKDDTIMQNDISFTIYHQITDESPEWYKSIDSLSKIAASRIEPSQIADYNGKKPRLQGCITYAQGMQLDSLLRSLDKKKSTPQ
ncbi:MAG TPA: hypothetical protein VIM55_04115 [Mucilaginibacter sp.]